VIDVTTQSGPEFRIAPTEEIRLDDGASLWRWLRPAAVPEGIAQTIRRSLPWEQPEIRLFGRWHRIPRLQCWCADAGMVYRYSGRTLPAIGWLPELSLLRQLTNDITAQPFNSVLANLYRDGDDAMGWHADDEAELGPAPWIASWSFGASREFSLRRKGRTRTEAQITLQDGDLLLMSPAVQQRWQHSLPRRKAVREPRLNLTFRQIMDG
jgi:alkylated DNA repair dioxygenase AlkB